MLYRGIKTRFLKQISKCNINWNHYCKPASASQIIRKDQETSRLSLLSTAVPAQAPHVSAPAPLRASVPNTYLHMVFGVRVKKGSRLVAYHCNWRNKEMGWFILFNFMPALLNAYKFHQKWNRKTRQTPFLFCFKDTRHP